MPVRRNPLAVVAAIGTAALVHDRPGRLGVRFDGPGVLLGACGIAGVSGAVPHFTGNAVLLPTAVVLLAAFVWWQTRTSGDPASPSGVRPQAHIGYFLATALANVGAFALLVAMGLLHY